MVHRVLAKLALIVAIIGCTTETVHGQTVRPLEPIAARLEPTRQVVYKTVGDRELSLHVFEPAGHQPTDRRPVFLAIHGGGWVGGEPRRFYPFADHFAQLGMLAISLEYRLLNRETGTTVFDCVRDGRSAVRFVRSHARELGIDPDRIVVAGGSAGGHLAAGAALFDGIDEPGEETSISCRPDVLVLYYPVIDTSEAGYGRNKIGERWRELSPVHHVAPGLPPTIVFHGTQDTLTPYTGVLEFQRLMEAADNTCELVSHDGGEHGYLIFDLDLFTQSMARTEEFLREQQIID